VILTATILTGKNALVSDTEGINNTAIGAATLANSSGNVSDSCFIGNIFGATSSGGE
jgi:hypothetical protein